MPMSNILNAIPVIIVQVPHCKRLKCVTKTIVLKPKHEPCTLIICLRVIKGKQKITAFCTRNTSLLLFLSEENSFS